MFRFYSACTSLVLILLCCFATANWVGDKTAEYIEKLETAQTLSSEQNWEDARSLTQEVYEQWISQSFLLHILLQHQDLDEILLCFQSVSQYLEKEDEEPYTANNAQLITHLKLLAEMEQLTLQNIL